MKKNTIKLGLLKHVYNDNSIIKDPKVQWMKLKDENGEIYAELHYREKILPNTEDVFFNSFFTDGNLKFEHYGKRNSGIILQNIEISNEKRTMLVGIGDIRGIIDESLLDMHFGLKTLINQSEEHEDIKVEFKGLAYKNQYDGELTNKMKIIPTKNFDAFDFNARLSILKQCTAVVKQKKQKNISMSNVGKYYPFSSESNGETILKEAIKFIKKYAFTNKYQINFKFIDYYSIPSKKIVNKLNDKMWANIENNEFSGYLTWPTFTDYNHSYFKVSKIDEQIAYLDADILQTLSKITTFNVIKNTINIASCDINGQEIDRLLIKNCLFFELEYNGKYYIYSESIWYEIEKNFIKKQNKLYQTHTTDIFQGKKLLDWDLNIMSTEKQYNEHIESKQKLLLLDRKLISIAGTGKMEIADLAYYNSETFFAVKNGTSTQNISYLITQVKNSINYIKNAPDDVNELLNKKIGNKKIGNKKIDVRNLKEMVLAIATTKNVHDLPKIPFLARVCINELFELKSSLLMPLKITWIKVIKKLNKKNS